MNIFTLIGFSFILSIPLAILVYFIIIALTSYIMTYDYSDKFSFSEFIANFKNMSVYDPCIRNLILMLTFVFTATIAIKIKKSYDDEKNKIVCSKCKCKCGEIENGKK